MLPRASERCPGHVGTLSQWSERRPGESGSLPEPRAESEAVLGNDYAHVRLTRIRAELSVRMVGGNLWRRRHERQVRPSMSSPGPILISRVALKNFRSVAACDIELGPLTFLVGANGAGKSNFLDALRLISDSLNSSLDHALRERGGVHEVRRRSSGHPTHFGVRIEFTLPTGPAGHLAFEVAARPRGEYVVKQEECQIGAAHYLVKEGSVVRTSAKVAPPASSDRLFLVNAAGLPEFRPLFDALAHMGFYNINPALIRNLQPPDKGEILARDGRNLASVIARMEKANGANRKTRVEDYLSLVVPGLVSFGHKNVGHMETVEFRQKVEGAAEPWRFPAINMSDGTLRAAAILVALFQSGNSELVHLVGLEEPETALHPAAAGVLRDCIFEATRSVQVIVTSHSAELLDDSRIPVDAIRAVEAHEGSTLITRLDEASRSALRDKLYTPGELLRMNQLSVDLTRIPTGTQLRLFGDDT
jgi:predicted ATPase